MDWSAVMFLSDSHSDGTHSLQSIHCWDTFLQTWWRNKLILILDDLRVRIFSYNCNLWVNYSFGRCQMHKYYLRPVSAVSVFYVRTNSAVACKGCSERCKLSSGFFFICCWLSSPLFSTGVCNPSRSSTQVSDAPHDSVSICEWAETCLFVSLDMDLEHVFPAAAAGC